MEFELPFTRYFLIGALIVMAALILIALTYAVLSGRFSDKIVGANIIGSLTINMVVIMDIFFLEDYILDIGIVYSLLSFLAVTVLCRVVTDHIVGKWRHARDNAKHESSDAGASEGGKEGV